ncbi:ABC transporter ATP-binding protein [Saccharomonospora piscinae]|uniref:ABC transporter ATP-binding protein n=1 Tax=Saccharomonospora piscinae TaxID=687388 RepID=UPI0004B2C9C0|nr:ABC transporter ATP-binding protein [Saccharomonospora piscinae]
MSSEPDGAPAGSLTTWTVVRRVSGRFAQYRWQVGASFVLVVLQVALGVAAPLLLQQVLDEALPQRDATALAVLCGAMIVIGLLSSVTAVAGQALTDRVGQRVVAALRVDLYDRARAQPLSFYRDHSEEQIQARLVSDVQGVERFLSSSAQSALSSLTSLIAAAIVLLILSWPLALLSFVLAFVLSLINNRFAQRRRRLFRQRQLLVTDLLRHSADDLSLGGVVVGRTLRRTARLRARFVELCGRIADVSYRQRVAGASVFALIGAAFACIGPALYWLAGTVVTSLSVGAVVVLVVLQTRLSGPIQSLLRLSGSFQASLAMFERIFEYLDLDIVETEPTRAEPVRAGPLRVRLRDVTYRYPGSDTDAVSSVDLALEPGSVTVIVGETGSGKSTLGLLLSGLLPPTTGVVETGGRGGTAILREQATLVPQHTTLFHTTVRENLTFACDDVTPADLDRALTAARLDTVVRALPLGHDTPVGSGGHRLSGGERQRLGVARALLARCRLLVVDEATSSLDAATAADVMAALREHCRDKTLVVITHQGFLPEPGDHVVVMEQGRIVAHRPAERADGVFGGPRKETVL